MVSMLVAKKKRELGIAAAGGWDSNVTANKFQVARSRMKTKHSLIKGSFGNDSSGGFALRWQEEDDCNLPLDPKETKPNLQWCRASEVASNFYAIAAAGAAIAAICEASVPGAAAAPSADVPFVTTAGEPLASVEVQSLLIWPGCPHL